jgi:ribonuclease Z
VKPSVVLLGTGGPRPDALRGCTGLLIRYGDDIILIDAGRGTVRGFAQLGIPLGAVGPVFITHHHYDHIGELHDVILSSWLMGRRDKLRLYGPPETRRIVDVLLTQVYDKDIAFRVGGEPANGAFVGVDAVDVTEGVVHETAIWRIVSERVVHGDGLDFSDAFRRRWICLGYRFECADGIIAFSGDTVDCAGLQKLAAGADILVICCYLAKSEIVGPHLERLARFTLASADTVGKIAARAGVKTLVLTHHRGKDDATMEQMQRDVMADFSGRVVVAEDLMTVEL